MSDNRIDDINERKNVLAQTHKQRSHSSTRPVPPRSPRSAGGSIYNGRYKGVVLKSSVKADSSDPPQESLRARVQAERAEEDVESEDIGLRSLLLERTRMTNRPGGRLTSPTRRVVVPDADDLPLPAPPQPDQEDSRRRSIRHPSSSYYGSDDEDDKQGRFREMTVDEALQYLMQHRDCQFLHVATRRSLEAGCRSPFYDMVILERPGFPESDLVWSKAPRKRSQALKDRLMQLSLDGLLYTDADGVAIHIPLVDFLEERQMTAELQTKRFFRYFYEKKVIIHWREWVCRVRFARVKAQLESRILLADVPLRTALLQLLDSTHRMESTIDIFLYIPPGSLNIHTFLQRQIERIDECSAQLLCMVKSMGDFVQKQYEEVTSYSYLQTRIEAIILHHPLSKGFQASLEKGAENVDWTQVRGVQRLYNEYVDKITRVLVVGQYMIDNAMVKIMHNFWIRLSQLTAGVDRVIVSAATNLATWDPQTVPDRSGQDMSKYEKRKRPGVLSAGADGSACQFLSSSKASPASADDISGQVGNSFISAEKQREGCFLVVDVALVQLHEGNTEEEVRVDPAANDWSLSQVKTMSVPSKRRLTEGLHQLYGALGKMLEDLPNLREHELVSKNVVTLKRVEISEDEIDKLEVSNKTSAVYFSNLKVSNILASAQLFAIAVRCMHQVSL